VPGEAILATGKAAGQHFSHGIFLTLPARSCHAPDHGLPSQDQGRVLHKTAVGKTFVRREDIQF
jgi:hypothetical protein